MRPSLKKARVGIMPLEEYKKRTLAIARGDYTPQKEEPKIWFSSMKSLANILSEENQHLLKLIADTHPQSVKELESLTGRKANNILRTLRTMENYGLVKLLEGKKGRGRTPVVPVALYEAAEIQICFG